MKYTAMAVAIAALVTSTAGLAMAQEAVPGDTIVQLATAPRQLGPGEDFPGMWEYVYDVVGTTDASGQNYDWTNNMWLRGFDSSLMVNRWNDTGDIWDGTQTDPWNFTPKQRWSANAAGRPPSFMGNINYTRWPSYWGIIPDTEPFNFSAWHNPKDVHEINWQNYDIVYDSNPGAINQAWYTDNPWHYGTEYIHGDSPWPTARAGMATWGQVSVDPGPDGIEGNEDDTYENQVVDYSTDGIDFENAGTMFYGFTGLLLTARVVHPNAPGEITWGGTGASGTILGPGASAGIDGDFDGDGDVDADDVDDLCANMGGDPATYDMDGDGDVDEDDMTYHVETYLEYDTDGDDIADGQGTFRGDFNADGTVNGTDLSILSGGFGTTTGFAGGNANCDTTVNGTDLSILSSVFGNVATAAVPEPLTMGLMSLGAVALLRRRK